ncbi:NAD(P)/FAD-dependent oxidoreductase [Xanthomonas massiliensis]|uniref:NAD(P)/FAD-dependent oxidoreductase n=1 Tax=Xanthomonas massiliensis TaxID=1720302 RepID=UPI000825A3BC|nr:NAD(P)/FAD-dependent oxidoreductase [Xanthomonas massiliensis]
MYDVIVIGGSYAGMAATLQLLRARRSVLVIDAGERRNRFASHSHGFLGQDGVPPSEIAATARHQLGAYPTLRWMEDRAKSVSGQADAFTVTTASGSSHSSRRILLATGVVDWLPTIDGLADRWGTAVFHCPYCHGYELNQGRIGIVGTGPMSAHQAELLTDWGEVTLFVNNALELAPEARATLARRGIAIEDAPINRIEGHADVVLEDGRVQAFAGLFVATRTVPSNLLAQTIGCAMEDVPTGVQIRTDTEGKTTVPGIFACGDVAHFPHTVSLAVGNGALTGAQVHRSLLWPETIAPRA